MNFHDYIKDQIELLESDENPDYDGYAFLKALQEYMEDNYLL